MATKPKKYHYLAISRERMKRGEPCLLLSVDKEQKFFTLAEVKQLGEPDIYELASRDFAFVQTQAEKRAVGHVR